MSKGFSIDKKGNINADEAFLKAFVANGGQVNTSGGTPVDNVDEYLKEVGKDHTSTTKKTEELHKLVENNKKLEEKDQKEQQKQNLLHEKWYLEYKKEQELEDKKRDKEYQDAYNQKLKQDEKEAKEIDKYQQDAKKLETKLANDAKKVEAKKLAGLKNVVSIGKQSIDPLLKQTGKTIDNFSTARTVGGIGLLIFILIFLLFIIVEVNSQGDTRIKQLWYMLVGRAQLVGRKQLTTHATPKQTSSYNPDISSLQDLGNLSQDISKGNTTGIAQDIAGLFNDTTNSIFQSFRTGF